MSINLKRTSPSSEFPFYASPIQKAEWRTARTRARSVGVGMSKHFQSWLGFVPCRNTLVAKLSSAAEDNDNTEDLPDIDVSPISPCGSHHIAGMSLAYLTARYTGATARQWSKRHDSKRHWIRRGAAPVMSDA